jgi:hypothetical protein
MKPIHAFLAARLLAPLAAMHAQPDSQAKTLGMEQLNAFRWGTEDAARRRADPAAISPAKWIWLPVQRTLTFNPVLNLL